ncbi:hypothetical protein [Exiguobacterium sp. ZOR0005]|uniref:hypothetical protein n=1 Tax=Exiguobacterium sp. ZOR0005 TaxID=1339226 RepID=UPI00068D3584|nr:hypothetical protein [Exiguobacterium sp. ZOR0005]
MHQLKLKRMWEDALEIDIVLTLKAKWCEVTVNEYVTIADIEALVSSLQAFNTYNGKSPKRWTLDVPLVHVSLAFELANARGTVQVNAVVEQMKGDGGDMKAAFSFETTMGQLDDLSNQIKRFIRREIDHVESLRPE